MSLFQCENCGCCENTALSCQGHREYSEVRSSFDWTGKESLKGKLVCSACGPEKYSDGTGNAKGGQWHDQFDRVFLPKGKFKTNKVGNLEHIETGSEDYRQYAIEHDIGE